MSVCHTSPWDRNPLGQSPASAPGMKVKLCDVNAAAIGKLPAHTGDKSGIGVHYVDAYVKPMNVKLEDGTRVKCKRRGLKITLTVGETKGDGVMRRLDVSRDPVVMLEAALQEAAAEAGVRLSIEGEEIYLEIAEIPCH
jgi:hypothetical protein